MVPRHLEQQGTREKHVSTRDRLGEQLWSPKVNVSEDKLEVSSMNRRRKEKGTARAK